MKSRARKSGQIFVLLAFFLAGLILLAALCADIFFAVRGKTRGRNAADAAALAAARWQGTTLNLIGELNLAHLSATAESNLTAAAGISALQERLAFAGPLMGFLAANRAARENGAPIDAQMEKIVRTSFDAATRTLLGTPLWPTKPNDYRAMLQAILSEGLYAGCDNAQILDVQGDCMHPLLYKDFYDGVQSENWCAICFHHCNYFATENDPVGHNGMVNWFATFALHIPIAALLPNSGVNPEYFGTSLGARRGYLNDLSGSDLSILCDYARRYGLFVNAAALEKIAPADTNAWFYLNPYPARHGWRSWSEMDRNGTRALPITGDVKPQFNVFGASSVARVNGSFTPLAASTERTYEYTTIAAAKPFGSLPDERRVLDLFDDPALDPLVLPAFSFVRLIPLFGANENNLDAADYDWMAHKNYLLGSPLDLSHDPAICKYCLILNVFAAKHQDAAAFLRACVHDEDCAPPPRGEGDWTGGVNRVP